MSNHQLQKLHGYLKLNSLVENADFVHLLRLESSRIEQFLMELKVNDISSIITNTPESLSASKGYAALMSTVGSNETDDSLSEKKLLIEEKARINTFLLDYLDMP